MLGIAILMLGHGLQGTLLGLRANLEAFQPAVTGMVMSGYYVGMLVGSLRVPTLVNRVGHVRVFAALLSLMLKKHIIADWEFVEELSRLKKG